MENKFGYLKIPLPMIRLLLVRPGEAENVIRFAVYNMAQEYAANPTNVFRQILWAFYQSNDFDDDEIDPKDDGILEYEINETLLDLWESGKMNVDFERRGFTQSGEFLSDDDCQITELEEYAKTDTDFFDECVLWYRLRQVCKDVGISFDGVTCFKRSLVHFENRVPDNGVFSFVGIEILSRFAQTARSGIVPEYARVQFACYAGIKSIIGQSDYGKGTKQLILARMVGLRSSGEISGFLSKKDQAEANKILKKYSSRKRFKKLLNSLIEYGYLKCCFGVKKSGFCFSTKLTEDDVMEKEISRQVEKMLANNRVQRATQKFARMMTKAKAEIIKNRS